ncbi:MAG: HNH endonuclease [Coraliomargarita sp.]
MKSAVIFERHVTPAEAKKGHITIRKIWWPEFEKRFSPIIHESKDKKGDPSYQKTFYLESTNRTVQLKLCRRNRPRKELRLYFSEDKGFKAGLDEIVTVRFTAKRVYIGKRPSSIKNPRELFPVEDKKNRRKKLPRLKEEDDKGNPLNQFLNTEPKQRTVAEKKVWARSALLANKCMRSAKYRCEAGMDRDTFTSKRTGENFVEVHHLIPISRQSDFDPSLDCPENLCCLSPVAHRAIHYGRNEDATRVLYRLLEKKRPTLLKFGINEDYLLRSYGLE